MEQQSGVTFVNFIISLGATAAIHLGDSPDPASGTTAVNLPAAGQMIDILAMLQEKTKGNLASDEQQLVDDLLYELRMRYIEATKQDRRIITP